MSISGVTTRDLPRWLWTIIVLAGLSVSVLIAHHGMIFSKLANMQVEITDTPFNNYVLEHGYQWLRLNPLHKVLWDPPMFYPATNLLAYSDLMLSFGPPYWAFRMMGMKPDTAFQMWMMLATTVNYLLFFAFLRYMLRLGVLGSIFGAMLFSCANARVYHLGHQQLFSQFYVLLALIATYGLFLRRDEESSASSDAGLELEPKCKCKPIAPAWWVVLGFLSVALQLWGGFYMGFFMLLMGMFGVIWALIIPSTRTHLIRIIREQIWVIMASIFGVILIDGPMAVQYLANYRNQHPSPEEVQTMLPRPYSWVYMGGWSVLYRWMFERPLFHELPAHWEHVIGLGFVTTIVTLIACWWARKRVDVWIIVLLTITVMAVSTLFMEKYTLWWVVYKFIPGAKAVRAVARIGLLLLIPASMALAYFVNQMQIRKLWWVGVLIATVCLVEQVQYDRSYNKYDRRDRITAIENTIPKDATAFYWSSPENGYTGQMQLDAAWAAMDRGIPAINGNSGSIPAGWQWIWANHSIDTPQKVITLRNGLRHWLQLNNIDPESVTWVNGTTRMSTSRDFLSLPQDGRVAPDISFTSYMGAGWNDNENDFRWNDGHESKLYFAADPGKPMLLRFKLAPLCFGPVMKQKMQVLINNEDLGTQTIEAGDPREVVFAIPATAMARQNTVTLKFPDAVSPAEIHYNDLDHRVLACRVFWFEVVPSVATSVPTTMEHVK